MEILIQYLKEFLFFYTASSIIIPVIIYCIINPIFKKHYLRDIKHFLYTNIFANLIICAIVTAIKRWL